MKAKHRQTLTAIFADPVNGNMEWAKIEALFVSLAAGSSKGLDQASPLKKMVSGHISTGRIQQKQRLGIASKMLANFLNF